jgi:uncharacterized membrane protein YdjX (TVP38/TMEM64 family)
MRNRRALILLILVLCVGAFFALGGHNHVRLQAIKHDAGALIQMWQRDPLPFAMGFVLLNIAGLALSLPGMVLGFGLAAGAIFGPWWGTLLALIAVVSGDSLAFLLARYVIRDWVETHFAHQAERANAGIRRDGAFYLLALRLMAVVPYFVVNLTMGITRLPLRQFAPVSLLGLIPVTFLYVQAGTQLARIDAVSDIYSPRLLVTLGLLGVLPLLMRFAFRRWRQRAPI